MSTTNRQSPEETALSQLGEVGSALDLTGTVLGDFQVEKLLGRGGMGEVYLATQLSLNRPVALKVLRSNFASNPTYLGRLKSEATAVAKLNHANIVHVYTLGCIGEINFIAMEYVQGTNLRDYILKKGALDLPLALSIMRQTGLAIGAAGEVGLIHRDIKPENILITKKGRVKVADFGLCRDQDQAAVHLTQTGVTMGTPLYMSPEQAQGHAVDHRSDLYSLGVTYYHMLAGVPPFQAETALAVALKQVREAPRSMLIHRPDLPRELDRLVMKLIAKSPSDRFQSAALMLADLAKIRDTIQTAATATIADPAVEPRDLPEEPMPSDASAEPAAIADISPRQSALGGSSFAQKTTPGVPWRLSWPLVVAATLVPLVIGAVAGWAAREPDVMAIGEDPVPPPPGLWLDPGWVDVPKQSSADEQLRFALIQAPRDEWVAAFLAVAGYFPRSRETISKAYTQLARIWHRRSDVDALRALDADLAHWSGAQKHDQKLGEVIRIAVKLKNRDFEGVVEGMNALTKDDVAEIYDPALVELSLEVCADAMFAASHAGAETILQDPLRAAHMKLVRQLFKIEVPRTARPVTKAAAKKS
jgi:eukaryotic-like serine/threonine-protein kinase